MMFLIGVKGIRIKAPVGVYNWEKEKGRDFEVDVEFNLSGEGDFIADKLSQTINYEQIISLVSDTMMKGGSLIEVKVDEIGKSILAHFSQIKKLKIRLSKMDPLNDGQVEKSFVERIYKQT